MAEKKSGFRRVGLGCLLTLGLLWAVWAGINHVGGPSTPADRADTLGAFTACQQFVEPRLKAPSSAVWPSGTKKYTSPLGEHRYRVQTFVDAGNSFGGQVRTSVDCTVRRVAPGKWEVEELSVQ